MPPDNRTDQKILVESGIPVSERQLEQFGEYAGLLLEWNGKVNLISRKDESNLWIGHILHSLSPLRRFKLPERAVIADLGSGGGLPGIPMAIALPQAKVVLIESIRKKCSALQDMVDRLSLGNIKILNARAEDAAALKEYGGAFDLILARAVAPLPDLIRWSRPLVAPKRNLVVQCLWDEPESLPLPALIAMKGGELEKEISDARRTPGIKCLKVVPVCLRPDEIPALANKSLLFIGLQR